MIRGRDIQFLLYFLFKILPLDKTMKPQASHLQTRVEHLFKLLKSEARKKVSQPTHTISLCHTQPTGAKGPVGNVK